MARARPRRASAARAPSAASRSARSPRAGETGRRRASRRASRCRSPRPRRAPSRARARRPPPAVRPRPRCSARRRRPSSAPATPPRLAPVSRTRSTSSSPAMPRRRRWAAKSKLASGSFAGRRRAAGERELVADRGAAGKGAPAAAVEAEQDARASERAAGDAGLGRGAERRGPGTREEVGADRDRPARHRTRWMRALERVEPGGADRAPRQEQGGGRPPRARARGRKPGRRAGRPRRRGVSGGAAWDKRESGSERADRHVPRPAGQVAHGCSASRSVASRFSPMPSTCASSASERKPPCASRYSMMRWASVGPMPSTPSSCSTVAVERWMPVAAPHRARPAPAPPPAAPGCRSRERHHDLLPVLDAARRGSPP